MIVDFESIKGFNCVTHPSSSMVWGGGWMYTLYNLDSRCSCGKLYKECRPELVEENKRRIAKYEKQE